MSRIPMSAYESVDEKSQSQALSRQTMKQIIQDEKG